VSKREREREEGEQLAKLALVLHTGEEKDEGERELHGGSHVCFCRLAVLISSRRGKKPVRGRGLYIRNARKEKNAEKPHHLIMIFASFN
jgi:hypothetical protein